MKTFLIFGGVGGIGQSLRNRLTQAGHKVYATTRQIEDAATRGYPHPEELIAADALDSESIVKATQKAAELGGGLDGLAYCIGSIDLKPLTRTTREDMLRAFEVNVLGAFHAVSAAAKLLAERDSSVVLFSSVAAGRGFANHAAIGTAKAGLEGLARSLAAELAPKVRVNVIAPSLSDTPLARSFTQNPKMAETIAGLHPIPKLGSADEIAALAEFLLLENASWMTGQVIHVDGGRSSLERK